MSKIKQVNAGDSLHTRTAQQIIQEAIRPKAGTQVPTSGYLACTGQLETY